MSRFAIKDAADILFINKKTKVPFFYTEDANSFDFKMSAESIFAKAKGNKAIAFDGEINCELKIEFEVIQFAQLSVLLASDVVDEANKDIADWKKVTLNDQKKATLKGVKPVEGSVMAFVTNDDGQSFKEKVEFNGVQNSEDYDITVNSESAKKGDILYVCYQVTHKKVKQISMKADGKSPNFIIEAAVAAKDVNGDMMALHLSIKNAKAKRNAELSFTTDNPSKFPMELDCFPDENGEYAVLSYIEDGVAGGASLLERVSGLAENVTLKK